MDYRNEIKAYIELEVKILKELDINSINQTIELLVETQNKEGIIYILGNGGSAATASHFQNDFNKGISEYTDKKFRFQCLNDNVATLTAIANDIGYEEVFRFQLLNKLRANDIVIAISGSGNSENVLNAAKYAVSQGCKVVGMTGYDGGKLQEISNISIHVPVNSMQITEDIHMIMDHMIMAVLYKHLCGVEHLK